VNNNKPVVFLSIRPTAPIFAVVEPLPVLIRYGIPDLRPSVGEVLGLFSKMYTFFSGQCRSIKINISGFTMYPISVTGIPFTLQYQIECKYPHHDASTHQNLQYLFKRISSFTFGLFGA
jgi:hypothetical protein